MTLPLKAPFPYFGGKSKVAPLVWKRLGDVRNYIEPFCGSCAMLLGRPTPAKIETVNDKDCFIANFWRAVEFAPELVVEHCNWPVNEADLHARHRWLVLSEEAADRRRRIKADPHFYDPQVAGWWVWGQCLWIGGGWCTERGRGIDDEPWQARPNLRESEAGVHKKRPALGNERGVVGGRQDLPQKQPKLSSNGVGTGVHRMPNVKNQLPDLTGDAGATGRGIHGSGMTEGRPQLADQYSRGRGVHGNDSAEACAERRAWLLAWFGRLQDRLRAVRVCCGHWQRVCGSRSVTTRIGTTGVFLDPPYSSETGRDGSLYAEEDPVVAHEVREWCLANGADPLMRIALAGYEGEHNSLELAGWEKVAWKAHGGYANRNADNDNADKERLWFSPHCLPGVSERLLDFGEVT